MRSIACSLPVLGRRNILPEESLLSYGIIFRQRMNMAQKDGQLLPQITIGNSETDLIQLAEDMPEGLGWWVEQYFRFEVTKVFQRC